MTHWCIYSPSLLLSHILCTVNTLTNSVVSAEGQLAHLSLLMAQCRSRKGGSEGLAGEHEMKGCLCVFSTSEIKPMSCTTLRLCKHDEREPALSFRMYVCEYSVRRNKCRYSYTVDTDIQRYFYIHTVRVSGLRM